jgi:hypothetical protein
MTASVLSHRQSIEFNVTWFRFVGQAKIAVDVHAGESHQHSQEKERQAPRPDFGHESSPDSSLKFQPGNRGFVEPPESAR